MHDYGQVFKSKNAFPLNDEWEAYEGRQLEAAPVTRGHFWEIRSEAEEVVVERMRKTLQPAVYDRDALSKAEYKIEEDHYPPTNRTMENFFRGAWTYHVHNQVCFEMMDMDRIRVVKLTDCS